MSPASRIASCSNSRPRAAHPDQVAQQPPAHASRPWRRARTPGIPTPRNQPSAAHLDIQPAIQRRAVEQDGFLRQPFHRRAGLERDRGRDPRRRAVRQRAVEAFRRLRRQARLRPPLQPEVQRQPIPAGDAARAVQRHHVPPSRRPAARKAHLQAALLAQSGKHGFLRPVAAGSRPARRGHVAEQGRIRRRDGVEHRLRPAPPAVRTARCRRGPSPRWSGPARGRNRNTAPPAGWPCRRDRATAR